MNATVAIDVRKWFLNPDGTVIDPTTATAGSMNLLQIENNIRRSFHAFETRTAKTITRVITATTTAGTTKPASGVAGTSSACYPSHLAASKFI